MGGPRLTPLGKVDFFQKLLLTLKTAGSHLAPTSFLCVCRMGRVTGGPMETPQASGPRPLSCRRRGAELTQGTDALSPQTMATRSAAEGPHLVPRAMPCHCDSAADFQLRQAPAGLPPGTLVFTYLLRSVSGTDSHRCQAWGAFPAAWQGPRGVWTVRPPRPGEPPSACCRHRDSVHRVTREPGTITERRSHFLSLPPPPPPDPRTHLPTGSVDRRAPRP